LIFYSNYSKIENETEKIQYNTTAKKFNSSILFRKNNSKLNVYSNNIIFMPYYFYTKIKDNDYIVSNKQ